MSEQKVQDENDASTEQHPMVQRISLEVQRREPNSVTSEDPVITVSSHLSLSSDQRIGLG